MSSSEATTSSLAPPLPPELDPALARFARGDFRGVHNELKVLRASHPAAPVEEAARGLEQQMAADPWALRWGLGALGLLLVLCLVYLR